MVPRSGHVVFDPASDHINYSDYLIDVDSWAAQYTDPSSLISPSEPTTSFQGDLYFPQGQNHPHHSYDHVPRTQLPTHQSIEMQLTRASPPPNQQSEKAYANQSTPGEPKLYKTAYGDTAEREFFIPGFLDLEHPVDAMGDTGANRNTMDVSFVRKRGYNIDCKAASIVRVGQGRVKTVGVVHVPFRFRGETTSYLLTFHVLPKCPQDVILGSTFLRLTKTFSNAAKFARRVFDRFVLRTSRHYNMLYLGGGGPTFTGTIGGRPHEALADTGSKVLIMDEDFARSRGLPIVDAEEHRIKLRFADGSTARTSGMTQGVTWQFGLAHEGKSFLLDFYILKDAPSNVILSENFLLRESQAFTEYSDYLLDDYEQEEDEEEGHVFVIRKETSLQYKGQYNGADQLCNDIAWDQEMDLRRNEDYRISVIYDTAARGAAEAAERLRRRQWENVHIITQTVQAEYAGTTSQDPPGASGVQPSGGGGVQPQATAQQNSSGANQTPSRPDALAGSSNTIPPSSRRDKFLKRFGRKRKQIT
ncbi:hypothetical protein CC77DRAFT_188886 [Alternaria alternata]|uniref:Uncharacterized protein n=1 Tax=Alternaria alternata TaxID=5599 RepID=A0A177DJX8_ALTAL|nr:hypothetical protein CC77DRAFT_188886 [Alternaria alternata]OAG19159.1 hypothetical protein CC77DRAFT_188886 [Alternaria alternata]